MKVYPYFLIGFLMMSCATSITYMKEFPAEFELPAGNETIGVVSAYDTGSLEIDKVEKRDVFGKGSSITIKSLIENLEQQPIQVVVSDSVLSDGRLSYNEKESLAKDRADLCRKANTSLLLVMEAYDARFDQEMEVNKNQDGSKERIAHYHLIVSAQFRLYDSLGKLIDDSFIERVKTDYNTRSVISGLLAVEPSLAKADDEVYQLSKQVGEAWTDRLKPSQREMSGYIYTHKSLGESTKALMRKKWKEAITLLTPLTDSDDQKLSGKACHNLSVAYDALGDTENFLYWSSQAKTKLRSMMLPANAYE